MNIFHISDTHGFHKQLKIPNDTDILIHSGDATNSRLSIFNVTEFYDFLDWFEGLDIKYKIYVAGNHDSFIYENNKIAKKEFEERNIIYLENNEVTIEGIKFHGQPITPKYGDWVFMKRRDKMSQVWDNVPKDTNVLITHGPPKGILDLTMDFNNNLKIVGCKSLKNLIEKGTIKTLKAVLFGHIHDGKDVTNSGLFVKDGLIYSNGACVTDGKFNKGITHQGNKIIL